MTRLVDVQLQYAGLLLAKHRQRDGPMPWDVSSAVVDSRAPRLTCCYNENKEKEERKGGGGKGKECSQGGPSHRKGLGRGDVCRK